MVAMTRVSSELGMSIEECTKVIELLAKAGDAQKRRNKRTKERIAYLQVFDQRKKSQVIKRKIRYQKKLP